MNRIFTLLIFCFVSLSATAQDIHFTQYYAAPLYLNPAMTGVFSGNFRLIGNYKTQWGSVSDGPYKTFAASYDMRIDKGFVPYDNFGLGIQFFTDKAGDGNLSDLSFIFSTNYVKVLNRYRDQFFSFGINLGINSRNIDFSKLTFGNQWDGSNYVESRPTGENFEVDGYSMAELGAGFMWYMIKKNRKSMNFGFSAHHINQPNVSFFSSNTDKLYLKMSGSAGATFPMGKDMDFVPSLLVMKQGPHTEINPGVGLRYHMDKETSMTFNVWDRIGNNYAKRMFNDAINIGARIDYKQIGLGLSYDINLSDLNKASNARGSFEISVVYQDKAKSRHKTLNCPKF